MSTLAAMPHGAQSNTRHEWRVIANAAMPMPRIDSIDGERWRGDACARSIAAKGGFPPGAAGRSQGRLVSTVLACLLQSSRGDPRLRPNDS
jgi:hypothetical protein